MSLLKPHQIWLTAGSKPYEASKAVVQVQLLSSRSRTEKLCRHWSKNELGLCLAATCTNQIESVEHILIECQAYQETRTKLRNLWLSQEDQVVLEIATDALNMDTISFTQFLLDCSVVPAVISAAQLHGQKVYQLLFQLTRTWCFALHRERLKLLDRWNFC